MNIRYCLFISSMLVMPLQIPAMMRPYPVVLDATEIATLETIYAYDLPCDRLSGCLNRCYLADNLVGNYSPDFVNFMQSKGISVIPSSENQKVPQQSQFSPSIYRALVTIKHIIPDKKTLLKQ